MLETFCLGKNYTRYEKSVGNKIVHLKKIHKFTSDHFLVGGVVFALIEKML